MPRKKSTTKASDSINVKETGATENQPEEQVKLETDFEINQKEVSVDEPDENTNSTDDEDSAPESTNSTGDEHSVSESPPETESFSANAQDRKEILFQKREREKERAEVNLNRQQTLMNWEQLKSARREKRILDGEVISVETINDSMVVCVLNAGGFRVVIPCSEMFAKPPIDMSTVTNLSGKLRRETQLLSRLIGSKISYIITEISGNPRNLTEYAIIASRKEALERTAAFYFDKNYMGKARINVGDIVEATITSVGMHAAWTNIHGIEISIPIFRLTYRYVGNVREAGFYPGQTIKLAITSIKYDDNGKCIGIAASGKIPEESQYIPKLANINRGALYGGRITHISQLPQNPKRTIVSIFLEGAGVPAIATYTKIDTLEDPPVSGDRVLFSVRDKREDRGIVLGTIMRKA